MYIIVFYARYYHLYDRIIWVGLIYLRLRTIIIFPNRFLNPGGCWKPIAMIHTCGFQDFVDKSILIKLKPTIIQCLDINEQELIHLLSLWVLTIVTGAILLEIFHYIINLRLRTFPKETIIHIYHINHSLRHEQAGIHITHHKTSIWKNSSQIFIPEACSFGLTI